MIVQALQRIAAERSELGDHQLARVLVLVAPQPGQDLGIEVVEVRLHVLLVGRQENLILGVDDESRVAFEEFRNLGALVADLFFERDHLFIVAVQKEREHANARVHERLP